MRVRAARDCAVDSIDWASTSMRSAKFLVKGLALVVDVSEGLSWLHRHAASI